VPETHATKCVSRRMENTHLSDTFAKQASLNQFNNCYIKFYIALFARTSIAMKCRLPLSIIIAEIAIALYVTYLAFLLLSWPQVFSSYIAVVIQLAWTVPAMLGIPTRTYVAWRIACTASAFFAAMDMTFGLIFFIAAFFLGNNDVSHLVWRLFCALYLFGVYCLLNRATVKEFFGSCVENRNKGEKKRGE
jgi:hypothetical protein